MVELAVARAVPFLRDLDAAAVAALAHDAYERRLAPGEVLFEAGGRTPGIVVVLEGTVRVLREQGGRRHVVHAEGPGGTLGELPVFDGGPLPATAVAAEPTRCVVFPPDAVQRAIRAHPELAAVLLARLAQRVRGLVARLDRLAARSVQQRLAEHLVARAAIRRSSVVTLGMTQAQLAEELGTVREVVVRELQALRRAGVLRACGGGRFEVLDLERLRALAAGTAAARLAGVARSGRGRMRADAE